MIGVPSKLSVIRNAVVLVRMLSTHDFSDTQRKYKYTSRQRTTWRTGMNPTGHYTHMLKGKVRKKGIQNNRDPYKEEIKFLLHIRIKEKILIIFPTQRIHIFSALQNDNVVNVFILNKENMTDLHVYTYIHTHTKIMYTQTQISHRKKKHKCCHDEPWRCRQTDKWLMKTSQTR